MLDRTGWASYGPELTGTGWVSEQPNRPWAAYHQTMIKVILAIAAIGVVIFALIDLWQVPAAGVRGGSRFLWTLAILLLPVVGAALWLLAGRAPTEGPIRRDLGPDDDPDFLRHIRPH